MSKLILIIEDGAEQLEFSGSIEPPNAAELPPTPALVVGTWIAAHIEQIVATAQAWALEQSKKDETPPPATPNLASQLVLPFGAEQ